MNLIEKLGLGVAEAIASCLLTTAINPEYFCLDPKQYFNVVDGIVYFYNDDEQQFFEYKPLVECDFEYVLIADLRTAIANHDLTVSNSNQNDKQIDLSIKKDIEDHCTDIGNHISPLTRVIEL
ncbi:hypothetical protein D3C78_185220 [compost metagenome]